MHLHLEQKILILLKLVKPLKFLLRFPVQLKLMAALIMLNTKTSLSFQLTLRKQQPKKSSSSTQMMRTRKKAPTNNHSRPIITIKTRVMNNNMTTIIIINMIIIKLQSLYTTISLRQHSNSQLLDKLYQKIKFLILFKRNSQLRNKRKMMISRINHQQEKHNQLKQHHRKNKTSLMIQKMNKFICLHQLSHKLLSHLQNSKLLKRRKKVNLMIQMMRKVMKVMILILLLNRQQQLQQNNQLHQLNKQSPHKRRKVNLMIQMRMMISNSTDLVQLLLKHQFNRLKNLQHKPKKEVCSIVMTMMSEFH